MDVFAFRDRLVAEHGRFSRSFTRIRAQDIAKAVEEAYDGGQFWPAPLIQLNPKFAPARTIDELVEEGVLEAECSRIFRLKSQSDPNGRPLRLHRHQLDAVDIARRGESYVLTTGTGSGKSLVPWRHVLAFGFWACGKPQPFIAPGRTLKGGGGGP